MAMAMQSSICDLYFSVVLYTYNDIFEQRNIFVCVSFFFCKISSFLFCFVS